MSEQGDCPKHGTTRPGQGTCEPGPECFPDPPEVRCPTLFAKALEELRESSNKLLKSDVIARRHPRHIKALSALLRLPPPEDETREWREHAQALKNSISAHEAEATWFRQETKRLEAEVERARRRSEAKDKVCFGYEQRIRELEAEVEKLEARPAMTEAKALVLFEAEEYIEQGNAPSALTYAVNQMRAERNPPPKRTAKEVLAELQAEFPSVQTWKELTDELSALLDEEGESPRMNLPDIPDLHPHSGEE